MFPIGSIHFVNLVIGRVSFIYKLFIIKNNFFTTSFYKWLKDLYNDVKLMGEVLSTTLD